MIDGHNRVLDYIERHLDDDIDIDELATLAVTSTYHLRRMFPRWQECRCRPTSVVAA